MQCYFIHYLITHCASLSAHGRQQSHFVLSFTSHVCVEMREFIQHSDTSQELLPPACSKHTPFPPAAQGPHRSQGYKISGAENGLQILNFLQVGLAFTVWCCFCYPTLKMSPIFPARLQESHGFHPNLHNHTSIKD